MEDGCRMQGEREVMKAITGRSLKTIARTLALLLVKYRTAHEDPPHIVLKIESESISIRSNETSWETIATAQKER